MASEGAVPLFLLIAVHLPVTMTLATILAEGRQASPLVILRRLATHPIVVGILAGSACRPLAPYVPAPPGRSSSCSASAAVPCALISMGIALRRYGLQMGWKLPTLISVLKLIVHPLVVLLLATLRLRRCRRSGPASRCCSPPARPASTPICSPSATARAWRWPRAPSRSRPFWPWARTLVWLYVLGVG